MESTLFTRAQVKPWDAALDRTGMIVEDWSSGWLFCGLFILAVVTVANMSRRLLHCLILVELLLAIPRGTVVFFTFKGENWLLSTTALCLYGSYVLHNIIAWLKIKPFLSPRCSNLFIAGILLTVPYWILETYSNYVHYNKAYVYPWKSSRVFEAPLRDPWWIFSCLNLLYNIRKRYNFSLVRIIRIAPRFGVMLTAMLLAVVFSLVDFSLTIRSLSVTTGVNPFWKISLVLKCLCDTIVLDDFKTALDRLRNESLHPSRHRHSNRVGSRYGPDSSVRAIPPPNITVDVEKGDMATPGPGAIYVGRSVTIQELDSSSASSKEISVQSSREVQDGW